MSVDIQLKHSSVAGKVPDAGDLKSGELALNTKDVKAYIKNADGQVVQIGGAGSGADDDRYVKLEGDDVTAQEITGTAGLKTEGLLESEGGVSVTGGDDSSILNGMLIDDDNLQLKSQKMLSFRVEGVSTEKKLSGINVGGAFNASTTEAYSLRVNANTDADTGLLYQYYTRFKPNNAGPKYRGYGCHNDIGAKGNATAFWTDLQSGDGTNYAFYSSNQAPNFFAGNTYIGGTTSRNTLELWKSTLTEEQLEQFEADKLPVPYNVSNPGDGEFARAWYYDQQDEETQLALDSGELEYPEHLAAATFTDTFALGDNTNINLLSTGLGEFKGGVRISGGSGSAVERGLYGNDSGTNNDLTLYNQPTADNQTFTVVKSYSGNNPNNHTNLNVIGVQSFGFVGSEYTKQIKDYKGFDCNNVPATSFLDNGNAYGFHSAINSAGPDDVARGVAKYGFYSAGTAPNYFRGFVGINEEAPDTALHVKGAGSTNSSISLENTSGSGSIQLVNGVKGKNNDGFSVYNNAASRTDFILTQDGECQAPGGFNASSDSSAYGFYSDIETADGYNFYSDSDRPSAIKGGLIVTKGTIYEDLAADIESNAIRLNPSGTVDISRYLGGAADARCINFYGRTNANNQTTNGFIETNGKGIKVVSNDSGFGPMIVQNSDARVKTLTAFTFPAADLVKLLNPGTNGFIAHELQAHVSNAVTGTQDETEAIGTLTDYDGTVLETEATEPSAEELTYTEDVTDEEGVTTTVTRTKTWSATGERDVYQGVDQTKLIPLLTKALQEALERIEALEAAAGGASVAKATTKKK